MAWRLAISLSCLLLALATIPVQGDPMPARRNRELHDEYDVLRRFPPGWLATLAAADRPDSKGFTGGNHTRGLWTEAGMQRGGCRYLIAGIIAGDLERAEEGWRSIEVTFSHQLTDGSFDSTPTADTGPADPYTARVQTAFFYLQELGRALLVLEASPLEPQFRVRVEALKPQVRKACAFIRVGYGTILSNSTKAVNRLFLAAKAFGLCGLLLNDHELMEKSRELITRGLEQRDSTGVFLEMGGRDSSYNAVTILAAELILLHLDVPELQAALPKAVIWELTRIKPDGEVDIRGNTRTGVGTETFLGDAKGVNYVVVIAALEAYGLHNGNADVLEAARRVYERWVRGQPSYQVHASP